MWRDYKIILILSSYLYTMCNRHAIHTMTVELHYKLHSKLLPVICTVK